MIQTSLSLGWKIWSPRPCWDGKSWKIHQWGYELVEQQNECPEQTKSNSGSSCQSGRNTVKIQGKNCHKCCILIKVSLKDFSLCIELGYNTYRDLQSSGKSHIEGTAVLSVLAVLALDLQPVPLNSP